MVGFERSQVKNLIERDTKVVELAPGDQVIMKNGGILLQGQVVVKKPNDKGILVEEGNFQLTANFKRKTVINDNMHSQD